MTAPWHRPQPKREPAPIALLWLWLPCLAAIVLLWLAMRSGKMMGK